MPNSGTASCPPAMYRVGCVDVPGCSTSCLFHSMCFPLHLYLTPYVSHSLYSSPRVFQTLPVYSTLCVLNAMSIPLPMYPTTCGFYFLDLILPVWLSPCVLLYVFYFLCIPFLLYSTHCVFHFLWFPTPTHPKRVRPSSDPWRLITLPEFGIGYSGRSHGRYWK